MKNVIFAIFAMLPLLGACAPEMAQQKTTTTTSYEAPYARPAVVEETKTTTTTIHSE